MGYISNQIKNDVLDNVTKLTKELSKDVAPDALKIEDSEKLGVPVMAEGREGLARLVSKVATEHEAFLNRQDNAADLTNALDYDSRLETVRQSVMTLLEYIDGTQWGNSADIMTMVSSYQKSLQDKRGDNSALDSAMNEIDEWNKRFGNRGGGPSNNKPADPQNPS